jgi:iron complex transport system ATP-binding protein
LRAVLGFQRLHRGTRAAPRLVGYVPQSVTSARPYRALDMVVMGRSAQIGLFGQPRPGDLAIARSAMAEVGVESYADTPFDRLSGGERQLVLVARALATGSAALVFDEPCAALDLRNQSRVLALMDGLRLQRARAVVFTTHDPNHALMAADDALLLLPDGMALCGPVAATVTAENLARLYGVPMRLVGFVGDDSAPRRAFVPAFAGIAASA